MKNDQTLRNGTSEVKYLLFSALCALITVLTTLVIHHIQIPAGNFEDNLLLYENTSYVFLKWIVMLHCLMVLFSMLGVALIIVRNSRALAVLGILFFSLFVFSEWERTLTDLWFIKGLNANYLISTDENIKQWLRLEIQHTQMASNVQFLLFTIGFTLGNACHGLALVAKKGWDSYVGIGLLLWSFCTACAFIYDFLPVYWMEPIISGCNQYYQPMIRLVIAFWLLKKAKQMRINT